MGHYPSYSILICSRGVVGSLTELQDKGLAVENDLGEVKRRVFLFMRAASFFLSSLCSPSENKNRKIWVSVSPHLLLDPVPMNLFVCVLF